MPITVLSDVVLPEIVMQAGVRGRQMRSNTRAVTMSGSQQINVNWDTTLREFELGYVPMLPAAWQAIEGLFEVTDAGAYGMLMLDPKDSAVATGLLQPWSAGFAVGTIGAGYGMPVHQLFKRISAVGTSRVKDRKITRPLAPVVVRGGVDAIVGAAPGNVSIDANTGAVTFVADAQQALASVTTGASTVLTFANASVMVAAMSVGQRLYLSGLSGTAAAALNGLSHAVTAKDAGAFTLTVSTNTTALAATGGTAFKYPQASEALTWRGRHYVPVHFSNDMLDWEILRSGAAETRLIAGPMVSLREVRE